MWFLTSHFNVHSVKNTIYKRTAGLLEPVLCHPLRGRPLHSLSVVTVALCFLLLSSLDFLFALAQFLSF